MKLYHFTAISYLNAILEEGLTLGEIPLSSTKVLNGVNLTSDASSNGHGLIAGQFLTENELAYMGIVLSETDVVPMFPDKRKVRITVDVEPGSTRRWMRWSRTAVDSNFRERLIENGGGMKKARSWYISFNPILPTKFSAVEVFERGKWVDLSDYHGPKHEVLTHKSLIKGFSEWGAQIYIGQSESMCDQIHSAVRAEAMARTENWQPEEVFA